MRYPTTEKRIAVYEAIIDSLENHENIAVIEHKESTNIFEEFMGIEGFTDADRIKYSSLSEVALGKILKFAPPHDKLVFIVVKAYLRVGQVLDTTHVRMVIDAPSDSSSYTDTVVQGLVGRCCGYDKHYHSVTIFTKLEHLRNYMKKIIDGTKASKFTRSVESKPSPNEKSGYYDRNNNNNA